MQDKDISPQSAVERFNKLGGCNTGFGYNEPLCPLCRCLLHDGDCSYKLAMVGSEEMASRISKAFEEVVTSLGFSNMFESKLDMLDVAKVSISNIEAIPLSEGSPYLYGITVDGIHTNVLKHTLFIGTELYRKLGFRVRVNLENDKPLEYSEVLR